MTEEELPAGWAIATIGDVSTDALQKIPPADWEFSYIDIGSIDRDTKKIMTPQRLLGGAAPSRARKLVATDDVLVSMTRPNLNAVALVPQELDGQIASTGFDVLRASGVEPKWLFNTVRSQEFVAAMSEFVQGALYPAVRPRDIREYRLPIAPHEEQRRIVDKLDGLLARVDACRERLERVPGVLKRFRQSVLAAATSGELTADWSESEGTATNWIETDVQSIAHVGTGSTPLRSNAFFYAPTGIPWITSGATAQSVVLHPQEFVTNAAVMAHRLKLYPVGTLLVAMYGEGKTRGQVSELGIEATINQACAAIVVNEERASKEYVKIALQANYLIMRDLAEGGNQPNLNLSKIKEFPLNLPPITEQAEIIRRVDLLFAYADRLESRYRAARVAVDRLTLALLAKAFRGDLVPQEAADEPASTLLAQVRAEQAVGANGKARVSRPPAKAGGN